MGSLDGLLELARVAEKDDPLRRRRHGESAGERELAGFVDDENVDGVLVLLAGPEPRGTAQDVDGTGAERGERLGIVLNSTTLPVTESSSATLWPHLTLRFLCSAAVRISSSS